MIVRASERFIGYFLWELIPNTYEMNVCDYCGSKRKTDYYQSLNQQVFCDICRTCRRKMEVIRP